jgi:hypothetical protein
MPSHRDRNEQFVVAGLEVGLDLVIQAERV